MTALEKWIDRKHARVCVEAGSCTCDADRDSSLAALRARAKRGHIKFQHPGPVDDCQSPHDVLCKAVWA